MVYLVKFASIRIHDSDSQYEFLGVVVVEDTVEIVAESGSNLLGDLFHAHFLISHTFSVQFDPQQPWRNSGHVKVGHFVINADPLLILIDDGVHRVGIVVDSSVCGYSPQSSMFQTTKYVLGKMKINRKSKLRIK